MGLPLSRGEVSAVMQVVDSNGDKVVDLGELEAKIRSRRKAGKHFNEAFASSHTTFLGKK
jgi:hypothetical protein